MKLLFATGNRGKIAELNALLRAASLPVEVLSLDGVAPLEIDEDDETFEANALKKARAYASAYGVASLADDSGLCVDALGGAPGIHSARFAGPVAGLAGDDANNAKLLQHLAGLPPEQRGAEFRCALALVAPGVPERTVEGRCRGRIVETPRGDRGFGYDPLFELPEVGRTLAELSPEEKNRSSHRARAFDALRPILAAHFRCGLP